CYVGITRAEQKLFLTPGESRRLYGQDNFNRLSRFVREIPGDLVGEVRLKMQVSRQVSWQGKDVLGEPAQLQRGSLVHHAICGDGVVLNFEGSGPDATVAVNFADEGVKQLVYQFAKLDVIG